MRTEYLKETILYLKGKIGIREVSKVQMQLSRDYIYEPQEELYFWQMYLKYRRRILVRNLLVGLTLLPLIIIAVLSCLDGCSAKVNLCNSNYICILLFWILAGIVIWGSTQLYFAVNLFQPSTVGQYQHTFVKRIIAITGISEKEETSSEK